MYVYGYINWYFPNCQNSNEQSDVLFTEMIMNEYVSGSLLHFMKQHITITIPSYFYFLWNQKYAEISFTMQICSYIIIQVTCHTQNTKLLVMICIHMKSQL